MRAGRCRSSSPGYTVGRRCRSPFIDTGLFGKGFFYRGHLENFRTDRRGFMNLSNYTFQEDDERFYSESMKSFISGVPFPEPAIPDGGAFQESGKIR